MPWSILLFLGPLGALGALAAAAHLAYWAVRGSAWAAGAIIGAVVAWVWAGRA